MLSNIVGVDDVSVIVNLDSTEEEVVQTDERESEQVTTERDQTAATVPSPKIPLIAKPRIIAERTGKYPLLSNG